MTTPGELNRAQVTAMYTAFDAHRVRRPDGESVGPDLRREEMQALLDAAYRKMWELGYVCIKAKHLQRARSALDALPAGSPFYGPACDGLADFFPSGKPP